MAGSNILHGAAMRIRVVGTGSLNLQFLGLDDSQTQSLGAVTLSNPNQRKMDRLGNFISQGVRWGLFQATALTDYARVNDVTVYIKEQWSQYPG